MPDTLTPPRPAPVTEEEPALYVCVWDHIARTLAWLDTANGRGPHQTAMQIMKITEEAGEAVAAYIGMTGTNPRKGVTATTDDIAGELCDVVLAALVALATITGGTPQAESRLARHVATRATRLRALRAAA
jgi:selenocysteine lyase/cysteine desulfurase